MCSSSFVCTPEYEIPDSPWVSPSGESSPPLDPPPPPPRRDSPNHPMLRAAIVCFATSAVALRSPLSTLWREPLSRVQRTRKILAQEEWNTVTDPDGRVYYVNAQTGESQWEPPKAAPAGYGAQVVWRVAPFNGVYPGYNVRNGEEQVLGRFDMIAQKTTVSRMQCILRVAPDGTATLVSVGRRPTTVRPRDGAPSFGLEKEYPHVLRESQYIGIDPNEPWGACFTCHVEADMGNSYQQQDSYQQQGAYQQQGGYPCS